MKKYQKAIRTVIEELRNDNDLYRAFQANIAMSYFDEARRNNSRDSIRFLHGVSNNAAINFLDLLIMDVEKPE